MNRNAKGRRLYAVIGLVALIAGEANAAERIGGMRQEPLRPPSGSQRSIAPPSRPDETRQPGRQDPESNAPMPGSARITFRGTRYVVTEGRWYRQQGKELVEVLPPDGAMVSDLPAGYEVRWLGGVPYFHANGTYYIWRERQRSYEIVRAPPGADAGQPAAGP